MYDKNRCHKEFQEYLNKKLKRNHLDDVLPNLSENASVNNNVHLIYQFEIFSNKFLICITPYISEFVSSSNYNDSVTLGISKRKCQNKT